MHGTFKFKDNNLTVCGETGSLTIGCREIYYFGNFYRKEGDVESLLYNLLNSNDISEPVKSLHGQFVILLYDSSCNCLGLIRDQLGQQPFYYSVAGEEIVFSVNVSSMLNNYKIKRESDPHALQDYFALKYTVPGKTMFAGVFEQLPGTIVSINRKGEINQKKYFDASKSTDFADSKDFDESFEEFRELFTRSLRRNCYDYDQSHIAVLSSGGIDSSILVSSFKEVNKQRFNTYYVSCKEYASDKTDEVDSISKIYQTNQKNIYITGVEFADSLIKTIEINDFPINSPSTLLRNYLYPFVKEDSSVILSGEGADCLYTGYYIFDLVYRFYVKNRLNGLTKKLGKYIPVQLLSGERKRKASLVKKALCLDPDEYLLNYDTIIVNNRDQLKSMLRSFSEDDYLSEYKEILHGYTKADILNRILSIYQTSYISENLSTLAKLGGVYNLEHRHPFMDHEMLTCFNNINWGDKVGGFQRKKIIVSLGKEMLPQSFFNMPTEGFGVPLNAWFEDEKSLGRYMQLLADKKLRDRALYNDKYLDDLLGRYIRRKIKPDEYESIVWPIINLELWTRVFIDNDYNGYT